MKGNSSLSERNFQPVLVDAVTAKLTAVPRWPLALSVMYLSQPLHFGDYAGLPLKIIWGIFDLIAIILLVSGLYLCLGRRGTSLRWLLREFSCGGAMDMPCNAVSSRSSPCLWFC